MDVVFALVLRGAELPDVMQDGSPLEDILLQRCESTVEGISDHLPQDQHGVHGNKSIVDSLEVAPFLA